VRGARRQPGSTVKPFVALEALDGCGDRPLHPASRVADEPVRVELGGGRTWEPRNADDTFRGAVTLRETTAESRNVPFVRVARHCGLERVARRFEAVGLEVPADLPPSFVLGAIETSPLALAEAYTVFATPGRVLEAHAMARMEKPSGSALARARTGSRRAARPASAWLARDLLVTAVREGTARPAAIDGADVAAKTGTSDDAWLAGHAGALVAVAWVGLDDGSPLELSGTAAAAPLWKRFVEQALPARAERALPRPDGVVEAWIEPESGLLVRERNPRAVRELFRDGAEPPRARFWRIDEPVPVVR
jgi:penicillin-binding protein 1B